MKIALSMKVDEVLKMFEDEFDIILKINKSYNSDTTLLDIATAESKNISLNITNDTRISALEGMFVNHFGIHLYARDMNMGTINPDVRIGDVRELYTSKIKDIDIFLDNDDRADHNKTEATTNTGNKKTFTSKPNTDNKNQYITLAKNDDHIEELILKIDKSYMAFQENEKYESMANLLSIIESSNISFPSNIRLNKHLIEIKTKSYSISNIAIKKRKFALIIFSIIGFLVLAVGLFILGFDIYNHFRSIKKIESISREINNLNGSKINAIENKRNEEALAIEKMIEENSIETQNIENSLNRNKLNIFLIIGIVLIIIIAILLVKLESYSIMSSRFYK